MYLSDLMTKEQVLELAFKHPGLKIKPRSKNIPDIDTALKVVVKEIENIAIRSLADMVRGPLQDAVDMQLVIDGEREDSPTPFEWDAAVDDKVEAILEPYINWLSADWMGTNTIDCRLHEPGGVEKLCVSFGREMYKGLTHDNKKASQKTPAQIMSSAGVLQKDVEARLSQHLNISQKESIEMENEQDAQLKAVVAKVAEYVGKDYDIMAVYGDLDLASDDDDLLAQGAAPRLGIDNEDVLVLQMVRLERGDDTPDFLNDLVAGYFSSAKKTAKTSKPPKKAVKEAAKPGPVVDAEELEGAIDLDVFVKLKDFGGAKDTDMAAGMGVSRATYNNWINGKNLCSASADQYAFLRGQVVERINKLHECLAALDGTEATEVF